MPVLDRTSNLVKPLEIGCGVGNYLVITPLGLGCVDCLLGQFYHCTDISRNKAGYVWYAV